MFSEAKIQALHRSPPAIAQVRDSPARNRDCIPRDTESRPADPRGAWASPSALLVRAWRSLVELRIDEAMAILGRIEGEIARADAPVARRSREFAKVLRAILLVLKSRDGATVRVALAVLESRRLARGRSSALTAVLRVGYWKVRDFDRYYAVPRLEHAVPAHRGTHGFATIIGSMFEAVVEAEQLRLAVATRLAWSAYERALGRFGSRSPVTARAAVVLAELLYEEGRPAAGLDALVIQSLAAVRNSGDEESAWLGYRILARLAARRGDTEFAFVVLKEAEVLAAAREWAGMMAESLVLRTQLLLKEGRIRDAAICSDRIEVLVRDFGDTLHASHALARAQVLVATGEAGRGVKILRELQADSYGKRNRYWALRLSIQLSEALLGHGDRAEGRALLIQALQVGARAGIYQTFVDAGTHVADLLSSLRYAPPQDSRLPPELRPYIESILADRAEQRIPRSCARASRVTESLSPREHSINPRWNPSARLSTSIPTWDMRRTLQ